MRMWSIHEMGVLAAQFVRMVRSVCASARERLAVVPELLAQSKHNINRRLTYLRGTVGLSIDDIMTQPKLSELPVEPEPTHTQT